VAEFVFAPAVKEAEKARLALAGPAGSGKTWSALSIAQGLGQSIAVIDTEKGSASKYAGDFAFQTLKLYSYDPRDLPKALSAAAAARFDVVIVDSLSHFWMGTDGLLSQVDRITARSTSKNSWSTGWKDVNPMEQAMIDALLTFPGHVIVTMRTKTEWVVEEVNGKKTPTKIGTKPIQRDGIEYEFDLVGDLDLDNTLVVSKTRISSLTGKVFPRPDASLGETVREWLSDGVKLPTAADYLRRLDEATDAEQVRALYREVVGRNLGAAPCTNAAGQSATLIGLITERGAQLGGKVAPAQPAPPPGQVQRSDGNAPESDPWATPNPAPTTAPAAAAPPPAEGVASSTVASDHQKRRLNMLVKSKLGFADKDRDAKLKWVIERIGRPIASTGELRFTEAKTLLDELEAMAPPPTLEQARDLADTEELFLQLQSQITGAQDAAALDAVYQRVVQEHAAKRISDEHKAKLDELGYAMSSDLQAAENAQPAGASA
jgi:hypothetical protein